MLRKHQQIEPDLSDLIDFVEEEMVLANDLLFSREALKYDTDKHYRSSKKRLMKSYAALTPAPAKEETEYTKQKKLSHLWWKAWHGQLLCFQQTDC